MVITNVKIRNAKPQKPKEGKKIVIEYLVTYTGAMTLADKMNLWNPTSNPAFSVDLPDIGDVCPIDNSVYCQSIDSVEDYVEKLSGIGTKWVIVTATFAENVQQAMTPIIGKDLFSLVANGQMIEFFNDKTGKPIVNTANQIFSKNYSDKALVPSAVITGLRSTIKIPQFSDKPTVMVNSDGLSFPGGFSITAKQAKIVGISATPTIINGGTYYQHSWQLEFAKDWTPKIANLGTLDKDGNRVTVKGIPTEKAWPLDSAGYALQPGFAPADVIYQTLDILTEVNFGSLFGWSF